MKHPDPAVQLLVDRQDCHDLMMRYASGVDQRNFDQVTACFTPDARAPSWGFEDRESLMNLIQGVSVFQMTMHMMGNQLIEVIGDEAAMETYAMLTHHMASSDGDPVELNMSGNRYTEKLRRTEAGWAIYLRGGDPVWSPTGVTGVTTDDPAVQWLLDRAEIHDLMMHYALGIDLREYERIRPCFAPSFQAHYGPMVYTNIDELLGLVKGVEFFASTTHFLGNQLIEVHGDRALMETYAMITHREDRDGTLEEWMHQGSSYIDELHRISGSWRIVSRGEHVERVPTSTADIPSSDDPVVASLLDRAMIHDVISTSALAIDRADWALYESCFTPAATDNSGVRPDRDEWESTFHFLGNQLVEIDNGQAEAETYVYITRASSPGERATPWPHGARRFVDRLRRDGRWWRIEDRRLETNDVAPEG